MVGPWPIPPVVSKMRELVRLERRLVVVLVQAERAARRLVVLVQAERAARRLVVRQLVVRLGQQ